MSNNISEKEFQIAVENEEYQKIMSTASRRFFNVLNFDEIESCKLTALWHALERYDPSVKNRKNKQSKFTSFLYRGVQLECKTAIKFALVGSKNKEPLHDNIGIDKSDIDSIDLLDEISSMKHGNIIFELFYNGLTIKELSEKLGVSKQIITIRKKRALNMLKSRLE